MQVRVWNNSAQGESRVMKVGLLHSPVSLRVWLERVRWRQGFRVDTELGLNPSSRRTVSTSPGVAFKL